MKIPQDSEQNRYWRRLGAIILFFLPIIYAGGIFGVALHELGHGLSALILGGTFSGFGIRWHGAAWAFAFGPADYDYVVLASGCLTIIIAGMAVLILAQSLKRRFFVRMVLLSVSLLCILGGASYIFWDSYYDGGKDISQALAQINNPVVRPLFLVFSAILGLLTIWRVSSLLFQGFEDWLGEGRKLSGRPKMTALTALLVMPPIISWYIADLGHFIPGVGLPFIVGSLIHTAIAIGLYRYSLDIRPVATTQPALSFRRPIIIAWSSAIIIFLAIWLWLSHGVEW